ncbi:MAG: cyclic 2,3-diphosphoglycerate synthase [Bacillota bacterium]
MKRKVLIMGAAGRDFHNFNTVYRNHQQYEVVGFTATQIPDIEGRSYPAELAGPWYPAGIPIFAEEQLPELIRGLGVDEVVFAYSDVPHGYVMNRASWAMSLGVDFTMLGPARTMLKATVPVVAVCAARTGVGKSQTTRRVCQILKASGKRVAVLRHPMPYGDLRRQISQRFASYADLDYHECTIEEREEYEPHIDRGNVVYAGVDYQVILDQAQAEADVVVWDGGNNDLPFIKPDIHITLVDPHRPGHELMYHPGETNLRMACAVVINKVDTANLDAIMTVRENVSKVNPRAVLVEAASPLSVEEPGRLAGRRVLVIEDGPTVTHGEMPYGAGTIAARRFGAEPVDPRPYAVGTLQDTFRRYAHLRFVLPAMGYGRAQVQELEATIRAVPCDAVIVATPIDLRRLVSIVQPSFRVRYELQEIGKPDLPDVLKPVTG